MKKLWMVVFVLTVVACMAMAGGKSEEGKSPAKQYKGAFAVVHAPNTPIVRAMQWFSSRVLERTDGNLTINVHPGGSLGGNVQTLEGVALGTIEMGSTGTIVLSRFAPEYEAIEMPFIIRSQAHLAAVMNGPIGDELKQSVAKSSDLEIIGYFSKGPRYLFTRDRVVKEPKDVRGLKLRLPPITLYNMAWQELGAVPVSMSLPETYTGLQTGVVDALEQDLAPYLAQALYEVTNQVMLTEHQGNPEFWNINRTWLKSLPTEYQKVLLDTAKEAMVYAQKLVDEETDAMFEKMQKQPGIQIHKVNRDAFVQALDKAAVEKWSKNWAPGLYERILKTQE